MTPENPGENIENNNQKKESELAKAQKAFIDIKSNKKDDIESIKIASRDWFLNNFKAFCSSSWFEETWLELSSFDENKKNELFAQLKSKLARKVSPKINQISSIQKKLKKEYDTRNSEEIKIEDSLWFEKDSKLSNLIISEKARVEYIKNLWKAGKIDSQIVNKKDTIDVLNNLNVRSNLSDEEISIVKDFIDSRVPFTKEDLDKFLNIFPKADKEKLIKYYGINLSVWKLEKLWLITKQRAKEIVKDQIKDKFWDDYLENNILDELVENIDKSDFYLDIESIDNLWIDIENIIDSDEIKKKIVEEINESKNDINEEIYGSKDSILWKLEAKWVNEDINDSFIDYIKNDSRISESIKNQIDNLQDWNYMILNSEIDWIPTQYFKIDKVDTWTVKETKTIKYSNITTTWWVSKYWDPEKKDYQSFYKHLLKFSDPKSKTKIELLSSNEFDEKNIDKIAEDDDIATKEELKKKLDLLDKDWIKIDLENTSVKINKQEQTIIWDIIDIQGTQIKFDTWEKASLSQFYLWFKDNSAKRIKKAESLEKSIENIKSSWSEIVWKYEDIEIKNNKIIEKSKEKIDGYKWVSEFIWNRKIIQIKKVYGSNIDVIYGDYKEPIGKDKAWTIDKAVKARLSYTEFYDYILENWCIPKSPIEWWEAEPEEDIKDFEQKSSWVKRWLGMLSPTEVIMSVEKIIDHVKNKLEYWNKLKSAKLSLKLWKIIPWIDQDDLRSMVEAEDKKTMEELVDNLTTIDSKFMIPKIEKILRNASAEPYEIEAAMMAVVKKYWTLYPKWLSDYRWTYIWYKKIWWVPNDALFLKTKKECEDSKSDAKEKSAPVPFTEEYLVEQLLKEQANKDSKYRPKRRSKIHKEFGNNMNLWIKDELEDGDDKTKKLMTTTWRINYVIDEFANWTWANGIWWMENIWAKNWSPEEMHAIPFIMAITWMAQNFPQELVNNIVWKAYTTPYSELFFNKDKNKINIFQNTVKKISEDLSPEMKDGLDSILGASDIKKKVYNAKEFWEKYWWDLSSILLMNNNDKDSVIISNKDKEWYWIYKEYYDTLKWIHSDTSEYELKNEAIWEWRINADNTPLFLTWGRDFLMNKLNYEANWNLKIESKNLLIEGIKQVNNIKNLDIEEEEKEKIFYEFHSILEPVITDRAWVYKKWWKNDVESDSIEILRWVWINPFYKKDEDKLDPIDPFSFIDSNRYKQHMKKSWENFNNRNTNNQNNNINNTQETVRLSIDEVINKEAENID